MLYYAIPYYTILYTILYYTILVYSTTLDYNIWYDTKLYYKMLISILLKTTQSI